MERNNRGIESVKTRRKTRCDWIRQFPSTQTPHDKEESGASQDSHDRRDRAQGINRYTKSAKCKRLSPYIDWGKMSVKMVHSESAATETRRSKSLAPAECYCRVVDGDLVADDWSRWKFTIAIQHARGMQE